MSTKLRYCLIGDDIGDKFVDPNKDEAQLSGLYQWSNAFQKYGSCGEIHPLWRKEEIEDYDIIHVNYTPSNIQLPTVIRNELGDSSSTKLVINVDLDVRYWGTNFSYHLINFMTELKKADILFHVEPKGAEILEQLLDRKVHTLPHPVDVTNIFDYMRKEREPIIGTIFHRYFPNTIIPFIAQKNIPLRRVLFGFQKVNKKNIVANAGMFDQILPNISFKEGLAEVSKCLIGCDLYEGFTYGRSVVELAALGIPSVCSSTISATEKLFPYTSVDPFDVKGAEKLLYKLYEDEEFCNEVIKYAHKECGQYSIKNSYTRFVEMLEN